MSSSTLTVQVPASHYTDHTYHTRKRYFSFLEQVFSTLDLRPGTVAEIGPGTGFVTGALKQFGIHVTTIDIDAHLRPDVVASVDDIPLPDRAVDAALCFEVLEHLPFERVGMALRELARISERWVFISVPDVRPVLRFELGTGWSRNHGLRGLLSCGFLRRVKPHKFDGEHYWEIGKAETPESRILQAIAASGLAVERHFRLHENPYHHFFLLRPLRIMDAGAP